MQIPVSLVRSIVQRFLRLLRFPLCSSPETITPPLPYELIDAIIIEAWWTAGQGISRWSLYKTLTLVSRTWRQLTMVATFRAVFIECPFDLRAYAILIGRHLASQGSINNDGYHHDLFKNSHICAIFHHSLSQRAVLDVAKLVPDAHSMDVSIRLDTLDDIETLLAERRSLTHLRLCWPPLAAFNDRHIIAPDIIVDTVTHLHIPSHPYRSLNSILALFPNVTHLRLSTETFLKDIVPNLSNVEVLTLDAPPNYAVAGRPFSSLRLWNITSALNKGLLKGGDEMSQRRIVVNTGPDTPDGWQQAADACAKHHIYLERRQVYTSALVQPHLSRDHWAHGKWL